jgi:hypothetical protein
MHLAHSRRNDLTGGIEKEKSGALSRPAGQLKVGCVQPVSKKWSRTTGFNLMLTKV